MASPAEASRNRSPHQACEISTTPGRREDARVVLLFAVAPSPTIEDGKRIHAQPRQRPRAHRWFVCGRTRHPVDLADSLVERFMSLLRRFALALCLLSSLEVGRLSAQQAGISGEWDGTIAGRLRVIVRIDHASDNSWRASLESVDQGHVKIDIDEVSFDGKKALQLEMKKIGASYKEIGRAH